MNTNKNSNYVLKIEPQHSIVDYKGCEDGDGRINKVGPVSSFSNQTDSGTMDLDGLYREEGLLYLRGARILILR
jgi:hypothetical protein